jgi:hypothetical protein
MYTVPGMTVHRATGVTVCSCAWPCVQDGSKKIHLKALCRRCYSWFYALMGDVAKLDKSAPEYQFVFPDDLPPQQFSDDEVAAFRSVVYQSTGQDVVVEGGAAAGAGSGSGGGGGSSGGAGLQSPTPVTPGRSTHGSPSVDADDDAASHPPPAKLQRTSSDGAADTQGAAAGARLILPGRPRFVPVSFVKLQVCCGGCCVATRRCAMRMLRRCAALTAFTERGVAVRAELGRNAVLHVLWSSEHDVWKGARCVPACNAAAEPDHQGMCRLVRA